MANIKVIIVEDHDMARLGLSVILSNAPNIEIAGMYSDGQEGVDNAIKLNPNVVVMDIGLPTIDGIEATRKIKAVNPNIRVLMYTSREDEDDVLDSFRAGADGYITKGATAEQTVAALTAVSEGAGWLDPAIARIVLTNIRRGSDSQTKKGAEKLVISISTTKTHVHSILQKLYVESRSKAISMAMKEGLV